MDSGQDDAPRGTPVKLADRAAERLADAKVLRLADRRPAVVDDVVEIAERMLEWARAGRITSLAYASVTPDGTIGSAWHSGWQQGNVLLGATALLNYRIAQAVDDLPDAPAHEGG